MRINKLIRGGDYFSLTGAQDKMMGIVDKLRTVSGIRQQANEVVVFGDNHNDIEMIKVADMRVAPENAVSEVKRIADCIIDSHDRDGVAKYICGKHGL